MKFFIFYFLLLFNLVVYSQVVINEVNISPNTNDGSFYGPGPNGPGGGEWVELFNKSTCNSVDVSGYILGNYVDGDGDGAAILIPSSTIMPPNSFLIIRGQNSLKPIVSAIDLVVNSNYVCIESPSTPSRMWFRNSGGWIGLYSKNGNPVDFVKWGSTSSYDLDGSPCNPPGNSLAVGFNLSSYNNFSSGVSISTSAATLGKTFVRIPDGGSWSSVQDLETKSFGTFNQTPAAIASISYNSPWCENSTPKSPVITGKTGGKFTSTTGLVIDANTGVINIGSSKSGSYVVTYTLTGTTCYSTTSSITITSALTPTFSPLSPICKGGIAPILSTKSSNSPIITGSWLPSTISNTLSGDYVFTPTAGQCVNSKTITFTLNPLPTVSVNSPTICTGGTATLTGVGASTYSWDLVGGTTGVSTINPFTTPVLTSPRSYIVKGKDANGCVNSATASISIASNLTITVNPLTVCSGFPASLSASGATSYSWIIDGASTVLSTANPFVTSNLNSNTIYKVTGMSGTCSGTNTVTVTVNPKPTTTASSNGPICAGNTLNLTATNSTTTATYSWTGPNNFTSTLQNPSISNTTTAGTGDYIVTVTDNNCSSQSTIAVVINPGPTSTAGSNSPICEGSSLNLTATNSAITGVTYNWTGPNSYVGTNTQNPTILNATNLLSGTYIVTISANGCFSTSSVLVTVNPKPTTTASSNGPICAGNTLNLIATNSTSTATYSWTGPNNFTSTLQNPSISNATTAGTGDYVVTVTDNNCSTQSTIAVVIKPGPITTAGSNSPICEGSSLNLTATNSAISGVTYNWTGPNSYVGTSAQNPTISNATNLASGIYIVTVSANGCSSTSSVLVAVNPIPTTTASSNGPICAGSSLNLSATNSVGASFSWTGPNNYTSVVQNPTIPNVTSASSGTYIVTVTANSCSTTSNVIVVINIGPIITASSNGPICVGNDLKLDVTSNTGITYSWTGPNGFASTLKNPTILSANTTESGQYLVTVKNNICSTTSSIKADVLVYKTPIFSQITPLCQNDVAPVLSSSSLDSPPIIGVWNPASIDPTILSNSTVYTFVPNPDQCSANQTMNIVVNPIPQLVVTNPNPVCEPFTIDLTSSALIGGNINGDIISYWGNSDATSSLKMPTNIARNGTYYIKNTSALGCSIIKPIDVEINAKPKAAFNPTPASLTTTNSTSKMVNLTVDASEYEWIFSDGEVSSEITPVHNFPNSSYSQQLIILIATSDKGCRDTTSKIVIVNEELVYYVPNTFTPDDDDFNQEFKPIFTSGYDPASYTLLIFNRWGEIVFESHDVNIGWDGTYGKGGEISIDSVYTWKIEFKLKGLDKRQVDVGSVSLLR
jgi:gliding motility-associated-like protein